MIFRWLAGVLRKKKTCPECKGKMRFYGKTLNGAIYYCKKCNKYTALELPDEEIYYKFLG